MDPLPFPQRKRRAQGWPGHLESSFEKGSSYSLHMLPISSKAFHVHASSSETAFLVNSAARCAAVLSHGGMLGWFSGTQAPSAQSLQPCAWVLFSFTLYHPSPLPRVGASGRDCSMFQQWGVGGSLSSRLCPVVSQVSSFTPSMCEKDPTPCILPSLKPTSPFTALLPVRARLMRSFLEGPSTGLTNHQPTRSSPAKTEPNQAIPQPNVIIAYSGTIPDIYFCTLSP